jgi:hypothetical protein
MKTGVMSPFQMANVAIPRQMFQEALRLVAELQPHPPPTPARNIRGSCVQEQQRAGVRLNARENGQINPSTTIPAAPGVGGRPHLTTVFQVNAKIATISASTGVIREIPTEECLVRYEAELKASPHRLPRSDLEREIDDYDCRRAKGRTPPADAAQDVLNLKCAHFS